MKLLFLINVLQIDVFSPKRQNQNVCSYSRHRNAGTQMSCFVTIVCLSPAQLGKLIFCEQLLIAHHVLIPSLSLKIAANNKNYPEYFPAKQIANFLNPK